MEVLNFNKYGLTFDAATAGPDGTVWVSIVNQEESHTKMIKRLEPWMPEGYNNVLVPASTVAEQFCNLPYSIKYLCI